MIVTRRPDGLALIDQTEHGRVAGELASHWGNAAFEHPTPRQPVLFATSHHDEGWRAWDALDLLNEVERRPLHFLEIDPDEHVRLYRQGVERIRMRDAYAGVLVGMHWTGLYRGRWSSPTARGRLARTTRDSALLDEVVSEEEHRWVTGKRAAWTAEQPRAHFEATLWHNYQLLQLWDLLSLYLCVMPEEPAPTHGMPTTPWGPQLASIEHSPATVTLPHVRNGTYGSEVALEVSVSGPGTVSVRPWPFTEPVFSIEIEQAMVPDRHYGEAARVASERARGRTTALRWTLRDDAAADGPRGAADLRGGHDHA
ncbi:DUF3891 family protein [Knoellia locipacati]|uniref:DUF3891 family protein n=1 Tax=Knoellia locipacati TaxID=882824 RepID=UPI00384C21D9